MKLIRSSLLITLIGSLLAISVNAQINSAENEQCNEEFGLDMVSQQVSEVKALTNIANRIRILNRSGDFIWPYDQTTARAYLSEAYKLAFDDFREWSTAPKKPADPKALSVMNVDRRFEVLRTIGKRDSAWAKKLTQDILADFEKNTKDRKISGRSNELNNLLGMATFFADTNKDLSWFVFRKVMEYPLESRWFWNLGSLSTKDDQMASALYRELLVNYRNSSAKDLLFLSAYPFRSERIMGLDRMSYGIGLESGQPPLPDLQQQFLNVFFDRISAYASNPQERAQPSSDPNRPEPVYMLSALNEIEPIVINEMPIMLQRFATAKAQATSLLSEEMRQSLEKYGTTLEQAKLTFEERLELIEKADEEGKLADHMIMNMIFSAALSEEQYALMQPWMDKLKDENVRKEGTAYFWFQRSSASIKDARFADAEKYAAKVAEIDHRSILAFNLAEAQMKNFGDTASALQTLNAVGRLVRTMNDSEAKAKILFGLANQYLKLDTTFAIDELAEAVRVLNNTKEPNMSTSSVFRQIIGKDHQYYAGFQLPGYNVEGTFETISDRDFGLALSNARAIDDRFLKTIAVISVVKPCMTKKKPVTDEATGN